MRGAGRGVCEAGALQVKQVNRAQRRECYGDSVHKGRNSGVIRVIYMILLCHTFLFVLVSESVDCFQLHVNKPDYIRFARAAITTKYQD